MERQIGATDLRQKLTDILQEIRDEKVSYVVETFGRPQAALISMEEYRRFQDYLNEREQFFHWMEETSQANAAHNRGLAEAELLKMLEQAREDAAHRE
jgi:prevent-host-death family protein